jgi:glycosyltransferase involved in cell wall biosynthesis
VGRLNRLLTPITDAFIAVAPPHARYLIDIEAFPQDKVYVIPNGVDTQKFRPSTDAACLRQELGIAAESLIAGIVAALRPEKNHSLFLNAAADVLRRLPTAMFLVVGDGPERPRLERLARELGCASCVRFLGNRSDVPTILSALDVFVLTSLNEANPVSILEAMSCGRPVVATDVGSVRETVRDGRTGRLVPPGDQALLVERIVELLTAPDYARELGRAGREAVVESWSLERMVAGYEGLITDIYCRKLSRDTMQEIRQWQPLEPNKPSSAYSDCFHTPV